MGLRVFFVVLAVSSGLGHELRQEMERPEERLVTLRADDAYERNRDPEGYTLQHVQMLQRHSVRAPSRICPPWSNASDYPMGLGYLTTIGKQKSIEVGRILREFYCLFLDNDPHSVWARSSPVPRCYETLSLLLGALYPPRGSWDFGYPVQPVPIMMVPAVNDVVIASCSRPVTPNFTYLFKLTDPALRKDGFENLGEFIKFVTEKAGYSSNTSEFFKPIIDALFAQRYNKLKLPIWAAQYPSSMDFAMRILSFEYFVSMIPHYGDYAGKFIAENVERASENDGRKKLSIMTYHDTNIQAVLSGLKMDYVQLYPYFLATLHFQLYKKNSDGTFWVRTLYHQGLDVDGSYRSAIMLKVPDCTFPDCPLDRFVDIMSNLFTHVNRTNCAPINREALL